MSDERRPIRHILVPHDFSETAQRALVYALDLAEVLGARVTLMHAYELVGYGYPDGPSMTVQMAHDIEASARAALEGVASRTRRPEVPMSIILRQGVPWSEIVAVAKEVEADLVAIGTHGRRGLSRMLLGSVTERVMRTAQCPVLTVHVCPAHAPTATSTPAGSSTS